MKGVSRSYFIKKILTEFDWNNKYFPNMKKLKKVWFEIKWKNKCYLVTNDCVNVRKMRFDELGLEESSLLERAVNENDVDNVVTDVTLSIQLKQF